MASGNVNCEKFIKHAAGWYWSEFREPNSGQPAVQIRHLPAGWLVSYYWPGVGYKHFMPERRYITNFVFHDGLYYCRSLKQAKELLRDHMSTMRLAWR